MNDIDLTPPACLRRPPPTPESRARSAKIVQEIVYGRRDWAPVRSKEQYREERKAEAMAKLNIHVQNRNATVEVHYRTGRVEGKDQFAMLRRFDSMDAFEAWYKPSFDCKRAAANEDLTLLVSMAPEFLIRKELAEAGIPVETAPSPARKVATPGRQPGAGRARPSGGPDIAAVKTPSPRAPDAPRRYIDMRHIEAMAEKGIAATDTPPTTFRAKDGTIVNTTPPPEGKKWATHWTLPDGRTGRGVTTLFKALGL